MQKELILIFTIIAFTACSSSVNQKQSEVQPICVQAQVVGQQTVHTASRYVGTIQAAHETPLSLQTPGRIVSIHCKDGERVRKGQLLLRVDNTQAVNALRSAEATLAQAQDAYNRVKRVHEKGAVTDQQMVEIESKLTQAKSLRDAAQRQLSECELRSPADGLVNGLDIVVGQTIVPGVPLLTLVDVSAYDVTFTVPENEINALAIGQQGEVQCPAIDTTLSCTVTEKSLQANSLAHTYQIRAAIQGGKDILRSGMVAKVQLADGPSSITNEKSPIIIPALCVHLLKNGPAVWVARNESANRVPIHVDGYLAEGVLISEGLQMGDTLIVDGFQKLYQGAPLTINF